MAPTGTFKPTLQLRHQLNCSGITIDAAAYDARRHHLLTYDSHALKPHTLRLFSLRREIRSTPLFDTDNPAPSVNSPKAEPSAAIASARLRFVSLVYACDLDVFVCVYSAYVASASEPTGYSLVFLEPASLKKLVVYNGPRPHLLQSTVFDEATGRLVLASRVATGRSDGNRKGSNAMRVTSPSFIEARSNVIEVVEISKRPFRRPASAISVASVSTGRASAAPLNRVMLCVERMPRSTLWHTDPIDCIAAAPRLRVLFGTGPAYDDSEDQRCVVLEWRESAEGTFVMTRRVLHEHDRITSLATSPSGKWLFSGHSTGILKVWNMASSTSADNPETFAPGSGGASSHQSAVATIEVKPMSSQTRDATETVMLFTTERGSGQARHWRFRAPRGMDESRTSVPQLNCLGVLDVEPTCGIRKTTKTKKRDMGWTRTIPLCVSVPMGSYTENLLVVTRGDVINVIKIQTLLQVVHDVSVGEEVFALRLLPSCDGSVGIVCFSGTSNFRQLQFSSMDPQSNQVSGSRAIILATPPRLHSRGSVCLTRLDVCTIDSETVWIMCGWSTGVVEVYCQDGDMMRRVALLQDPRLDVDITALTATAEPAGKAKQEVHAVLPKHSWGGLLKSSHLSSANVHCNGLSTVLAGTSTGAIYGWQVPIRSPSGSYGGSYILEASIGINSPPAHSAHVVELIALTWEPSEPNALLSMGADGILKLWALPSMRLVKHINAAASSGASGTRLGMLCSCVQVLSSCGAIVVGYEDGAIAAWRRSSVNQPDEIDRFDELSVSGRHDRRVTSIVDANQGRFLTASLDMTVVLWRIVHESSCVEEVRFFELGEPVIDLFIVGTIALAGLRAEVCWFYFDEEEGTQDELSPPPLQEIVPLTVTNGTDDVKDSAESDVEPDLSTIQPEDTSPRSPGPSHQEESVISIPSVIVPGSATNLESFGRISRLGSSGPLEGWLTDPANDSPLDADVISLYVHQFVATCGSSGTIAAESLTQFLSVHHIPLGKRARPDFVIRKCLYERKIDPKTRLNASEATAIILDVQRAAGVDSSEEKVSIKSPKSSTVLLRNKTLSRLSQPRKKANRMQTEKPTSNKIAVVTYNILGEKSIKWATQAPVSNQEAVPKNPLSIGEVDIIDNEPSNEAASKVQQRRKRRKSQIQTRRSSLATGLPDPELIQRVRLSSSFRSMWSTGYCWCDDSQLIVQWDTPEDKTESDKKAHTVKCAACGRSRHRLTLQSKDYKPHFTIRSILGIIIDVFALMMEPAHHLLFRNDESSVNELSIHAALWKLFLHKFGVQHIVETKLKLLFVSMCHFVREVDAIAVFGELLGLFHRPGHDEPVPHKMVALCVVTHCWLYAREMVINGDAILGNADSSVESSKTTHWQFVTLTNALFCAQEVLVYPLVSPGYMQNILMYMDDYAQSSATKPTSDHELREEHDATRWIEVHRLLRLLVGEWKQQTAEFRAVERLLFTEPLAASPDQEQLLAPVLEKLRLILSCFVFYDHERVGLAEVNDFEDILRRLKYLWPNEHLSEQEAAGAKRYQDSLTFENTILAARKRFGDADGDGRICYLDFWAMLYIVGVRTRSLLKFREIPSFCKDYKLEVSPELHEMLCVYMQRSSALLLPRGFHTAKSSVDESTHHQHQRRSGGLHDGVYIVDRPKMAHTLSMSELLSDHPPGTNGGLYIDGSVPSMRQSASTTALDVFNSSSRDSTSESRFRAPVVVGVRTTGPQPKRTAYLTSSSLGFTYSDENCETVEAASLAINSESTQQDQRCYEMTPLASAERPESYGNVYIQFPNVTPRKTRVDLSESPHSSILSVAGPSTRDYDDDIRAWRQEFLEGHEQAEHERRNVQEEHARRLLQKKEQAAAAAAAVKAAAVAATRGRHRGHVSPPRERQSPPKADVIEKAKSSTRQETARRVDLETSPTLSDDPVVVVPTIEKHAARAPVHGVSTIESITHHAAKLHRVERHDVTESGPAHSELAVETKIRLESDSPRNNSGTASTTAIVKEIPVAMPAILDESPMPTLEPIVSLAPVASSTLTDAVDSAQAQIETDDVDESDGADGENESDNPSEDEASDGGDDVDHDEERVADNEEEDERKEEPMKAVVAHTVELPTSSVTVIEAATLCGNPKQTPLVVVRDDAKALGSCTESVREAPTKVVRQESVILNVVRDTNSIVTTSIRANEEAPVAMELAPSPLPDAREVMALKNTDPVEAQSSPKPVVLAPSTSFTVRESPSKAPNREAPPSPSKPVSKPTAAELRHKFKFSQQPRFKLSAAMISNPFRSSQWRVGDDSNSDDSEGDQVDDDDLYDDDVAVEDMRMRLSRRSLNELRNEYHRRRSSIRAAGLATMAFSNGSTRQRLEPMDGIDEGSTRRRGTERSVRLDEAAERALYGGRAQKYLGEGIAFSAELEELMQHKWNDFFGTAEATMFSPLKDAIQHREEAQRQEEEMQSRLMKKRLEEQRLDTLRLQRSKVADTTGDLSPHKSSIAKEENANFRVRRLTREASLAVQQQLKLGETASGELNEAYAAEYFHFEYSLDGNAGYSIITFKLRALQGEADLFLSTQTTAPCSSDFMWRSAEKSDAPTALIPTDVDGQKIVLFPHDVARVAQRSGSKIVFYLAVVALAPNCAFTLGVMTSGQKAEPSRAIQTVDNLIAHFNQLVKTYEGQASRRVNFTADSRSPVSRPSSSGKSSVDRLRAFLASAASADSVEEENDEGDNLTRRLSSRLRRRESSIDQTDNEDSAVTGSVIAEDEKRCPSDDDSSFQQLLESFGQKHGLGRDPSQTIVLSGTTAEQSDFLQDEEARYEETVAQLSPVGTHIKSGAAQTDSGLSSDDGECSAIAVVMERRLSAAASRALQERLGAKVKRRLSPLKPSSKTEFKPQAESASVRVAQFEPKLVAYSLSSLPPPKRAQIPRPINKR